MTNYREILRLHSLGLNKTEIASSCQCARNTVAATLQRAANCGLQWPLPEEMSDKQLSECLFPSSPSKPVYKMPDYASVHKELQRSGVTLNLLWLEYCDQCRAAGEIPYQSTQFNKYYADYLAKVNATMHLNHKPGEVMQVDWAGDTATVIDTDTGEIIPAYVFVATLPYSGYSYVEAFFSMNQETWSTAHVNAYKYFGGVTRIIQCDNLKTGVQKHGKDEVVLNKLNMVAKTSGLTKQDYILKQLLKEEVIVHPNCRVQKILSQYLTELTEELKRIQRVEQDDDILENIIYLVELIAHMGIS